MRACVPNARNLTRVSRQVVSYTSGAVDSRLPAAFEFPAACRREKDRVEAEKVAQKSNLKTESVHGTMYQPTFLLLVILTRARHAMLRTPFACWFLFFINIIIIIIIVTTILSSSLLFQFLFFLHSVSTPRRMWNSAMLYAFVLHICVPLELAVSPQWTTPKISSLRGFATVFFFAHTPLGDAGGARTHVRYSKVRALMFRRLRPTPNRGNNVASEFYATDSIHRLWKSEHGTGDEILYIRLPYRPS